MNCANVFSLGSSNWLLTEKHCACAFVIFTVLTVCLSVQYRHSSLSNCGPQYCSVRQYFCTIAAAVLQYSLAAHVSASHRLDGTADRLDTKSFSRAALVGDEMGKNEMGGACSTYGGGEVYTGFWDET